MTAVKPWIDGVVDGFVHTAHTRDAAERKAFYRNLTLAELEAESEHLTLSFAELDEDVTSGKWTADDALIVGRGLDIELEAILAECGWRNKKPGYRAPSQISVPFAQDLKSRVDGHVLAELVARYHPGTFLKREGDLYRGLCVFHTEKSPSMAIYKNGHFYCTSPQTRVLTANMRWTTLGTLSIGDSLAGFDEMTRDGCRRRWRSSTILAKRDTTLAECVEVETDSGQRIICTKDHRWLVSRSRTNLESGSYWLTTDQLREGTPIRQAVPYLEGPEEIQEDYRLGYLLGMTEGDGTYRYTPGLKSEKRADPYWRIAICDLEPLERLEGYLREWAVPNPGIRPFNSGNSPFTSANPRPMYRLEVRSLDGLSRIAERLGWKTTDEFARGYLAAMFDAEGSYTASELVLVYQNESPILDRVTRCAEQLGYRTRRSLTGNNCVAVILAGGTREHARFLIDVYPAIMRKKQKVFDRHCVLHEADRVVGITPVGVQPITEILTSTSTFIAQGLTSHNCWGCGVGGDVYSFFKAYGMTWVESVRSLAGYLGVEMPRVEVPISVVPPIWERYPA